MSEQRRPCDVVMKGGVTSGVVYPAAVCEIVRAFNLKNIGGTSAGAIAAAVAAAAQYRRLSDDASPEAGFEQLATIPDWLAADNNLFALFAPDARTRGLFDTVVALIMPQPMASRVRRLIAAHWISAAAGALPGILYLWVAVQFVGWPLIVLHVVAALVVLVAGALFGSVLKLLLLVFHDIPKNGYGMVRGAVTEEPPGTTRPQHAAALCSWLAGELERIAGLEVGTKPLTFRMLWQMTPESPETDDPPQERAVNLEMITTSLTQGRPYRFPCSTVGFYFRESDLEGYFPVHVIKWLVDRPRAGATPFEGFRPLPAISELPVIVATRMSLSFPLLLSAVPLYAVDYTAADANQQPQPCWFSDGGICSNFPIALFDAPLPRWPTLAINLGSFTSRTPADGVIMPQRNSDGIRRPFSPIAGVASFLGAIISTMQNWNDDEQSMLPGFRDRIATVALHDNEGGLNLQMQSETLEGLKTRGSLAGQMLRDRFEAPSDLEGPDKAMNWENHRWLRFRTTMAAASQYLRYWNNGYVAPVDGDVTFAELESADHGLPTHSYAIAPDARAGYAQDTGVVAQTAAALAKDAALEEGCPKPTPELVLRAKL